MTIANYPQLGGNQSANPDGKLLGRYRLNVSTGAATLIAARTGTAGQLLNFRRSSSASTVVSVDYVGARFILTTAYTTAQETGCDLIMARSFTVSGTNGTAVDLGSTVTNTGKLYTGFGTSVMGATAGTTRVATSAEITAGTHTLDANPIGILSGWSGGIGGTIPLATDGARGEFGSLFDARDRRRDPIVLVENEGFVIRNLVLMGATGVGRWDFCVEWSESTR